MGRMLHLKNPATITSISIAPKLLTPNMFLKTCMKSLFKLKPLFNILRAYNQT